LLILFNNLKKSFCLKFNFIKNYDKFKNINKENNDYRYSISFSKSHSSVRGNWALFLERLGVNTVRLFVDAGPSLRKIIDAEKWGQNLRGEKVTNQEQFIESIQDLRSKNGRNTSFDWINPGFSFFDY